MFVKDTKEGGIKSKPEFSNSIEIIYLQPYDLKLENNTIFKLMRGSDLSEVTTLVDNLLDVIYSKIARTLEKKFILYLRLHANLNKMIDKHEQNKKNIRETFLRYWRIKINPGENHIELQTKMLHDEICSYQNYSGMKHRVILESVKDKQERGIEFTPEFFLLNCNCWLPPYDIIRNFLRNYTR